MLAADIGCDVEDVVVRIFGLEGTKRSDEYDLPCPHPAHEDSRPSASVNLNTGLWNCFSCGRGGDLLTLGSVVLHRTTADVLELLKPNTPESLLVVLNHRMEEATRRPAEAARAVEVPFPHQYADGPLDSLIERGFSLETLSRWDVRYVPAQQMQGRKGPFTIYASVGIPVQDDRGQMLAWCYRRTASSPDWQPRYLYTSGAEGLISEAWFGLRHHYRAEDIVVVEGALDAMWCDQWGVPALGLLGSSMGKRKLRQLTRYRSVTLLCDLDAGGAAAVRRIGEAIGSLVPLRVARYRSWMAAKDPAELHPVDLELVLEAALPWAAFCQKFSKETRASRVGLR